jgi:hypothetical protein
MAQQMFKKIAVLLLATGIMTLTAQTALADRYERQVIRQLREAERQLGREGFRATHDYFTDKIYIGRTDTYRVTLDGGREYMIVAFCDSDCDDVDLYLYDNNDNLIDEDVELDDFPLVSVSPKGTGRYQVEVAIPGCHAGRCTVGIGIYGR